MDQIKSLTGLSELDLLAIGGTVLLYVVVKAVSRPIGRGNTWVAKWFLFNGIVIHLFLDGLVGGFGLVPPLFAQYSKLDGRYREKEPLVMLVCYLELGVMLPLCLLAHRAIVRHRPERHVLQLATSLVQLIGTYFFTLTEVMGGFRHVPVDRRLEFTFQHVFYFWIFFVAANLLWSLLPLYLIAKAWGKIVAGVRVAETSKRD